METFQEAYLNHIISQNDYSSYQETMGNVYKIMEFLYKSANVSLKNAVEEAQLDLDDLDADEKTAVATQILDDYDTTIDSISSAYSIALQTFKLDTPNEIVQAMQSAAKMLMREGVTSDYAIISTLQGIAIYSDFAEFTTAEICMQVFPEIIPTLIQFLEEK